MNKKNFVEIIFKCFTCHVDFLMALTYVDELYIMINSLE